MLSVLSILCSVCSDAQHLMLKWWAGRRGQELLVAPWAWEVWKGENVQKDRKKNVCFLVPVRLVAEVLHGDCLCLSSSQGTQMTRARCWWEAGHEKTEIQLPTGGNKTRNSEQVPVRATQGALLLICFLFWVVCTKKSFKEKVRAKWRHSSLSLCVVPHQQKA